MGLLIRRTNGAAVRQMAIPPTGSPQHVLPGSVSLAGSSGRGDGAEDTDAGVGASSPAVCAAASAARRCAFCTCNRSTIAATAARSHGIAS